MCDSRGAPRKPLRIAASRMEIEHILISQARKTCGSAINAFLVGEELEYQEKATFCDAGQHLTRTKSTENQKVLCLLNWFCPPKEL